MHSETDYIMLSLRCKAQAGELGRQRERIFELKQLNKKLARKISEKQKIIQEYIKEYGRIHK